MFHCNIPTYDSEKAHFCNVYINSLSLLSRNYLIVRHEMELYSLMDLKYMWLSFTGELSDRNWKHTSY